MTEFPYILLNKSPEHMRQLGACGGRAYGRNQRARALVATPPEAGPSPAPPAQTAAEAIHLLDTHSFRGCAVRKPDAPAIGSGSPRTSGSR
jgi:hypothetical protein